MSFVVDLVYWAAFLRHADEPWYIDSDALCLRSPMTTGFLWCVSRRATGNWR